MRTPVRKPAHELQIRFALGGEDRVRARIYLGFVLAFFDGDVRRAAKFFGRTDKTIHGWITAWGLREWLDKELPREDRFKRNGAAGHQARGSRSRA